MEFNTEAGRAGGILEIGEARGDISNPGEPPQLSGPPAPPPVHRTAEGEKVGR